MVVADVEIGEYFDQAGADLAKSRLLALSAVVGDDAHDRVLDGRLVCEQGLGVGVIVLFGFHFLHRWSFLAAGRDGLVGRGGLGDHRGAPPAGCGL